LGWAAANARGWDVKLLGLVTCRRWLPMDQAGATRPGDIHNVLAYVLLGFIALHIAGALYHYFMKKDWVLQRMLAAD
jgi:cytochrome b561